MKNSAFMYFPTKTIFPIEIKSCVLKKRFGIKVNLDEVNGAIKQT